VWRLLGVDARLRRAGPSFGPPATLITLLGLLTFGAACAYAVSPDAAEESVSSDPGQSAYAAGRFIDALRIWRPRAEQGALSHCRSKSARELRLTDFQAAATASRHVVIAAARSTRCDLADVRWRWTLKVL
jgi:hypothetical protein